jgi:hypothetical protein
LIELDAADSICRYVVYGKKPENVITRPTPEELRKQQGGHRGPRPESEAGPSIRKFQV